MCVCFYFFYRDAIALGHFNPYAHLFFFATLRIYKRCVSWSIQTANTEIHKLGVLNNRLLFSTVLETEKSKIKVKPKSNQ